MAHLSFEERRVISRSLLHGISQTQIAQQLGRSPSTISREIGRNRFDNGHYHAQRAHRNTIDRRCSRTVTPKLERPGIYEKVADKLELNWSPQQICGWLTETEGSPVVSHQTIYSYLWCLPKDHAHRLGMRRRGRRPRKAKPGFITKKFKHRVSIHDRPKAINERLRMGDWELDLMTCIRPASI
jgi:IS30 family transposase